MVSKKAGAIAALLACAVTGCAERTQIVVVADTNLAVPGEIDTIHIEVSGPEGMSKKATADLRRTELPAVVGIVQRQGSRGPLRITVVGQRQGQPVLRREARTSFVEGRTLRLDMNLLRSCVGRTCGEGRTCTAEGCVSVDVDPDTLPEWNGPPMPLDATTSGRDAAIEAGGDDPLDADRHRRDAGGDAPSDASADSRDSGPARPMDAEVDVSDGAMDTPDGKIGSKDATPPECTGASDCDDGVPCTVDRCEGGVCNHSPDDGACAGDGIACTVERCDPSAGCRHVPDDGRCDDGIACTDDFCDTGGCVFEPDDRACMRGERCETSGGGCTTATTFSEVYDDILSKKCGPCHTSRPRAEGGLDMKDRKKAFDDLVDVTAMCGAGGNTRVIPYDATNSLLWRKVADVDLCGARMPLYRDKLPTRDIDAIADWINAGAADN